MGQDKQRKLSFKINVCLLFVFNCLSATFALQHGGFAPREWLATKGLFTEVSIYLLVFQI